MKKVRIMSNLIADELKMALDESGIQLDEDTFEEQVSGIVDIVNESVKKACEGEECEDCDKKEEEVDEEDDEEIMEDGTFYFAPAEITLGGKTVAEGEYVEVEETEDGIFVNIYDEDGELKDEGIEISAEERDAFIEAAEELEDEEAEEALEEEAEEEKDDEEVAEGAEEEEVDEDSVKKFKVQNGKKVKLTPNQIKKAKLKARGRLKKGYKFVDGKQVKMTAAEKAARRKLGKKLAKKGKAKRARSLKKARQLAAGSDSGTCVVKEGFDISVNGLKLSLEAGDEVTFTDGKIEVVRDGKVIFSEVPVSESFIDRCITEAVLEKKCNEEDDEEEVEVDVEVEDEEKPEDDVEAEVEDEVDGAEESEDVDDGDEDDEEEKEVEEGAILTFKANKGYVFIKEGVELPMGNRIRARATLSSKGYTVTAEMLDNASNGKVVVL